MDGIWESSQPFNKLVIKNGKGYYAGDSKKRIEIIRKDRSGSVIGKWSWLDNPDMYGKFKFKINEEQFEGDWGYFDQFNNGGSCSGKLTQKADEIPDDDAGLAEEQASDEAAELPANEDAKGAAAELLDMLAGSAASGKRSLKRKRKTSDDEDDYNPEEEDPEVDDEEEPFNEEEGSDVPVPDSDDEVSSDTRRSRNMMRRYNQKQQAQQQAQQAQGQRYDVHTQILTQRQRQLAMIRQQMQQIGQYMQIANQQLTVAQQGATPQHQQHAQATVAYIQQLQQRLELLKKAEVTITTANATA